jgi:Xaa-Pro aminopeptidase
MLQHWNTGGLFLVVPAKGDPFAVTASYPLEPIPGLSTYHLYAQVNPNSTYHKLEEVFRATGLNSGRIGIEKDTIPVGIFDRLQLLFPNAEFVGGDHLLMQLRMIKDDSEIANLKKAIEVLEGGIKAIANNIEIGMSQLDLMVIIRRTIIEAGAIPSHELFEKSLILEEMEPYNPPKPGFVEEGKVITIDCLAGYSKYIADLTRQVVIGSAADKYRTTVKELAKIEDALAKGVKPGMSQADALKVCMDIKQSWPFEEELFIQIHGLGLEVHERPLVSTPNVDYFPLPKPGSPYDIKFAPNMILNLELGTASCTLEDAYLLDTEGMHRLTELPREILIASR